MCLESFDKEIDNVSYRTYEQRLRSFKSWKGKLDPEILAAVGFYYLNIDDVCKCYYCGVEIYKWLYEDCPIDEHYKLQKNCDLLDCLRKYKMKKNHIFPKTKNVSNNYILFSVIFLTLIQLFNFVNIKNLLNLTSHSILLNNT